MANSINHSSRFALAPLQSLLFVLLTLALATMLAIVFALQPPWLGLTFSDGHSEGLRVERVDPDGPAAAHAQVGDIVSTLIAEGRHFDLRGYPLSSQPHAAPTLAGYHAFLQREGAVANALRSPEITLVRADGSHYTVAPARDRTLASLPVGFWLLHLYGTLACMIGVSVWVFLPRQWPPRLLALSGVGMFIATWQHSLWEARELALPATLFDLLMRGNHLAVHGLLLSLLLLLVLYPRPLPHFRRWAVVACSGVAALLVNENLEWLQLPFHTFYLPLLFYYLLGTRAAWLQWQRSRCMPEERGALRWVLLSTLLTLSMGMVVYFLPVMLDIPPVASPSAMVGVVVTLYLGFALGILRYRLFDLERWWFIAWMWFLGGLSVLLVDVAVITWFGLRPAQALGLSVVLVGWGYFPARQWVLRRMSAAPAASMEQYMPAFVAALYDCEADQVRPLWEQLLQQAFRPLSLEPVQQALPEARIAQNGARLLVPDLENPLQGLSLRYSHGGRRLFNRRDEAIARALTATATRINQVREAREHGARQERQRIMRDLHDEVGARLLSLILTAPDEQYQRLSRKALAALRETIYVLDHTRRHALHDMLEDWCADLHERLTPLARTPDIVLPPAEQLADYTLTPRQYVNLRRVLDEAVSNALKHGCGTDIRLQVTLTGEQLEIALSNPLRTEPVFDEQDRLPGRGMSNMKTRMAELSGELRTTIHPGPPARFVLEASLPL